MSKKIIVFDFDGTLSKKGTNIWKALWVKAGCPVDKSSDYAKLYVSFMKGEISHKEWCDLTCDCLMEKGLSKGQLKEVISNYFLIDGFETTIKNLKNAGYELHIVSGGIKKVIYSLVGKYSDCFETINANDLIFNEYGMLSKIEETVYDFEGKARFITELLYKNPGITSSDITFVGNGDNDEWAYRSGCNTLCINPDKTDSSNKTIWHDSIENVTNLTQILPKFSAKNEKQKDTGFML